MNQTFQNSAQVLSVALPQSACALSTPEAVVLIDPFGDMSAGQARERANAVALIDSSHEPGVAVAEGEAPVAGPTVG